MEKKLKKVAIRIKDKKTGKMHVVGYLFPTKKTFVKVVFPFRHLLHNFNGYAIQTSVLDKLAKKGVKNILVLEKYSGDCWKSSLKNWREFGCPIEYRNYGEQEVLNLRDMALIGRYTDNDRTIIDEVLA